MPPRKSKGKTGLENDDLAGTGLENDLEGTADVFGDLQGQNKSGLSDDIFGFKAELGGKKKKGKGKKGSVEDSIGNIYGGSF